MHSNSTVLILWFDGSDELAATAFTTMSRKACLCIELVGLIRARTVGARRLVLMPDITLEQASALADHVATVILPGGASVVRRLGDDPRVRELIGRACADGASLITSTGTIPEVAALAADSGSQPAVVAYGVSDISIVFTDYLTRHWSPLLGYFTR